jgi:hypothetical protein
LSEVLTQIDRLAEALDRLAEWLAVGAVGAQLIDRHYQRDACVVIIDQPLRPLLELGGDADIIM